MATKKLSWTGLADRLGISRQRVWQHRTRGRAPRTPDLSKWRAYLSGCRSEDHNFTAIRGFNHNGTIKYRHLTEEEFYGPQKT